MVNKERVQMLVNELRTTTKEQGTGHLKRGGTYCCLGVATELAIANGCEVRVHEVTGGGATPYTRFDGSHDFMPQSVINWYGFDSRNPIISDDNEEACGVDGCVVSHSRITATGANDELHWDFPKIADGFEKMYLTEASNG